MRLYQTSLVLFLSFFYSSFCLDFSLSSSAGANSLLFHFILHVIYMLLFSSQAPCPNCCPLHLPSFCGYFLLYAHNWYLELKNIDEREHVALVLLCLSCLTQYTFWGYIHFPFLQMNRVHMHYIFYYQFTCWTTLRLFLLPCYLTRKAMNIAGQRDAQSFSHIPRSSIVW